MITVRSLVRSRLYLVLAVATMGVGLGSMLAVLGLVDIAVVRPLPFPAEERLVVVQPVELSTGTAVGWLEGPLFEAVLRHRGLELVSYTRQIPLVVYFDQDVEPWSGVASSRHGPGLLGVKPLAGRLFSDADHAPGGELPILINASTWRARFGGSHDAIGRVIRCDGFNARIIGVFADDTLVPSFPHAMRPTFISADRTTPEQALANGVLVPIARMRAGFDLAATQAEMRTQLRVTATRHPKLFTHAGVRVSSLRDYLYGSQRTAFRWLIWVLVGVAAAVCINSTSLSLARLRRGSRDLAVQRALGATRPDLIIQSLAQNALVAALSVPISLLCAALVCAYVRTAGRELLPAGIVPAIDLRAVVYAFAIAGIVALVVTVACLPELLRVIEQPAAFHRTVVVTQGNGSQSLLVAMQLCLVFVLLVAAGLMVRTVWRLAQLDVGATVAGVQVYTPKLPRAEYSRSQAGVRARLFWDRLLDQVQRNPDTIAAALAYSVPMMNQMPWASLGPDQGTDWQAMGGMIPVTPSYFETLGIPLRRGRTLTPRESDTEARVGVINETAARIIFPEGDPVGKTLLTPWFAEPYTIVGVAADTRYSPDIPSIPTMYVPIWRVKPMALSVLIRSKQAEGPLHAWLTSEVRRLEPHAMSPPLETYHEIVAKWRRRPLFLATVLGAFAVLSLAMAAVGTAAVVGYSVVLRYREFGIRMALGATRHSIHRLALKTTFRAAIVGIGAGALLAASVGRLMQHELYGMTAVDPSTYALAAAVLLLAVLVAAYVPARIAGSVDPVVSLRQE